MQRRHLRSELRHLRRRGLRPAGGRLHSRLPAESARAAARNSAGDRAAGNRAPLKTETSRPMPYRTLNTDEVAQYLNLPRADIERLCKDRDIPFEMRGSHVVFRQRDIEAWASQRILSFNTSRLVEYHRKSSQQTRALPRRDTLLPGMIRLDCIAPAMTAKTKASVLRDLAAVAERTGLVCDRAELVASLQAREKLCPSAVPGG